MSHECGFGDGKRVDITNVKGQRVPKFGSREPESSLTHVAEEGRGHRR